MQMDGSRNKVRGQVHFYLKTCCGCYAERPEYFIFGINRRRVCAMAWYHIKIMYTLRTSCEDFPELTQNTSGPAMLTMYLRWCVSPTCKTLILLKFCDIIIICYRLYHIDDGLLHTKLGNKLI